MKFFIDTANVEDIRKANDMGIICGVTTNPSLIDLCTASGSNSRGIHGNLEPEDVPMD